MYSSNIPRLLLRALSRAFTGPLPNPTDSIFLLSTFKITLASELRDTSLVSSSFLIEIE